jgi:hypothetical protein
MNTKRQARRCKKQRQRDAGNTVKQHKKIGKGDVRDRQWVVRRQGDKKDLAGM